jgi:hypothetical protein
MWVSSALSTPQNARNIERTARVVKKLGISQEVLSKLRLCMMAARDLHVIQQAGV